VKKLRITKRISVENHSAKACTFGFGCGHGRLPTIASGPSDSVRHYKITAGRALLLVAIAVEGLLVGGCRQLPGSSNVGRSSFVVLDPPSSTPFEQDLTTAKMSVSAESFHEARPLLPLAEPIYPPRAMAAKAGRVIVGVRVIVDITGRISSIEPSMRTFSTPGPFEDDFLEAVRAALQQWRFLPAEIEHHKDVNTPGVSDHTGTNVEAIETSYDISFIFTPGGGVQPPQIGH